MIFYPTWTQCRRKKFYSYAKHKLRNEASELISRKCRPSVKRTNFVHLHYNLQVNLACLTLQQRTEKKSTEMLIWQAGRLFSLLEREFFVNLFYCFELASSMSQRPRRLWSALHRYLCHINLCLSLYIPNTSAQCFRNPKLSTSMTVLS